MCTFTNTHTHTHIYYSRPQSVFSSSGSFRKSESKLILNTQKNAFPLK